MTCGVCSPDSFRPSSTNRVFGYVTFNSLRAASRGGSAPDLYYLGAERVVSDLTQGNVRNRPGYRLLCKVLRAGDKLVIDNPRSFGREQAWQETNMARLEAMGVEIAVLTQEGKGVRYAG